MLKVFLLYYYSGGKADSTFPFCSSPSTIKPGGRSRRTRLWRPPTNLAPRQRIWKAHLSFFPALCLIITLQDVPTRLYISKEKVLEEAMHLLSLKIHDSRACAIGNNQVIGSICIDVPAHGEHPALKRKFFGDYKMTEADALESARLAALIYLQHACIILVDDVNHIELTEYKTKLTECHCKLQTASSWVTLFQERAETLQKQLDVAHEENRKLVDAAKVSVVKKEGLSPQSVDLKTAVLPLPTVGVKQEMASPTLADNKTGGSLSRRGKKRAFHESNARRALFKE